MYFLYIFNTFRAIFRQPYLSLVHNVYIYTKKISNFKKEQDLDTKFWIQKAPIIKI